MTAAAGESAPGAIRQPEERRGDATVAHAYAAIDSMLRLSLRPSPEHFRIWYDYHAGENALLRRVLDTYLSNGRRIDDQVMRQIHERFCDPSAEARLLRETAGRLQEIMGQAAGMLGEAGADATRYGSSLSALSDDLAQGAADPAAVVRRLLAEMREMQERNATLAARLEALSQRVALLEEKLEAAQREASTDPLTGLPNRRAFDHRLQALAGEAMNSGAPLSLLLLDVDRFKAINDGWGHPVGDAVLRRVAAVIGESLGAAGHAARFGGEEFAAILPGQGAEAAARTAERLRAAVAGQTFTVRATGRSIGSITVSVGVAAYRVGESLSAWLERADAALYQAKQAGRNRVVVWNGAGAAVWAGS